MDSEVTLSSSDKMRNDFDVFLSHNSKDKVIVCELAEWLRKDGLRVWFRDGEERNL